MVHSKLMAYRAAVEAVLGVYIARGRVTEEHVRDWLDEVLKDAPEYIPHAMSHARRMFNGPKPFDAPPIS